MLGWPPALPCRIDLCAVSGRVRRVSTRAGINTGSGAAPVSVTRSVLPLGTFRFSTFGRSAISYCGFPRQPSRRFLQRRRVDLWSPRTGFEPSTRCLQGSRSTAELQGQIGTDSRTRTCGTRLRKAALCPAELYRLESKARLWGRAPRLLNFRRTNGLSSPRRTMQ